jgi:hypothetical protein
VANNYGRILEHVLNMKILLKKSFISFEEKDVLKCLDLKWMPIHFFSLL